MRRIFACAILMAVSTAYTGSSMAAQSGVTTARRPNIILIEADE